MNWELSHIRKHGTEFDSSFEGSKKESVSFVLFICLLIVNVAAALEQDYFLDATATLIIYKQTNKIDESRKCSFWSIGDDCELEHDTVRKDEKGNQLANFGLEVNGKVAFSSELKLSLTEQYFQNFS